MVPIIRRGSKGSAADDGFKEHFTDMSSQEVAKDLAGFGRRNLPERLQKTNFVHDGLPVGCRRRKLASFSVCLMLAPAARLRAEDTKRECLIFHGPVIPSFEPGLVNVLSDSLDTSAGVLV